MHWLRQVRRNPQPRSNPMAPVRSFILRKLAVVSLAAVFALPISPAHSQWHGGGGGWHGGGGGWHGGGGGWHGGGWGGGGWHGGWHGGWGWRGGGWGWG